jgi:DegV family protein with EDD domain
MNKIVLIADSAVDLDATLRAKFGIADYVHGIVLRPDGTQFLADCDWENMTPEEYFGSMAKGKKIYRSATCSGAEAEALFKKHLEAGEDVLAISIASVFSGIYNLFVSLAKRLAPLYPKQKIAVVDSCRYSGGYALLCLRAHELIEQGLSFDEVVAQVEKDKNKIHQFGPLDDLFFLNRSGRVSRTIAIMGTMVGIRPLADFQKNGYCGVLGKTKGENHALEVGVKYVEKTITDPNSSTILVCHSNRPEEAKHYAELLTAALKPAALHIQSVGQISGANIGPGLVAAFYFGAPISEDLAREKALLAELLQ